MASTNYDYVDKTGLYYALGKIKAELQAQYISYDDTDTQLGTNIDNVQKAIAALNTAMTTIEGDLDNKVDVEAGKGLSTNDFDNTYKQVLDDLATTLANYALLSGAEFTGTVKVPTAAAATNDTTVATTAYVTSAVAAAVGAITGLSFDGPYNDYNDLITQVPTGSAGYIYLVKNSGSAPNANDEYFWNTKTNTYELFGTTAIDLSDYVKTADLPTFTAIPTSDIKTEMINFGYHITA